MTTTMPTMEERWRALSDARRVKFVGGMCDQDGRRLQDDGEWLIPDGWDPDTAHENPAPDFEDPATPRYLLTQARKAWDDLRWHLPDPPGDRQVEVLLAALEVAADAAAIIEAAREDWLRALRRFLGISQSEAAANLGVTVVSWGRWECSMTRPKSEHVVNLAEMARQPLEEVAAIFGY